MKILYLADIRFRRKRANGIRTGETARTLARRGVEVDLVVRRTDEATRPALMISSAFPLIQGFGFDEFERLSKEEESIRL
jgi:hypothetical protein